MHPVTYSFETSAGTNLSREMFLKASLLQNIRGASSLSLRSATSQNVSIVGKTLLHFKIGHAHIQQLFGVVRSLTVPILLGISFIDIFLNEIFPLEHEIVLQNSALVLTITTIVEM